MTSRDDTASADPPRRTWVWWMRRRLVAVGVLLLAWWVAMFPLGCGTMLADRMLLFPTTHAIGIPGASERFVETPAGRVQVLVARSPGSPGAEPARFVLRLDGNGGRAEHVVDYIARRWADEPTEVWAMNYPGFGRSPGPARLTALGPSAVGAYDALVEFAGDRPIYLDADSMGTAVALHVAATRRQTRPPRGLLLKNAPPLRQMILRRYGWWNLWLAAGPVALGVPRQLDSVGQAARAASPAIFLSSTGDTLVPPRYQRLVYDAYAGPKRLILFEGADHNTPVNPQTEDLMRAAVRELMP